MVKTILAKCENCGKTCIAPEEGGALCTECFYEMHKQRMRDALHSKRWDAVKIVQGEKGKGMSTLELKVKK